MAKTTAGGIIGGQDDDRVTAFMLWFTDSLHPVRSSKITLFGAGRLVLVA